MAYLVILESPAKANTVKGYLGSNYKVAASVGHVRDLPKSTLGVDIDDHFKAKYINIRGKGPLIKELKKEAKAATKVFLATDPDREGEAISWHLAAALELDPAKTKRVTFNEITKNAVLAGMKNPREIDMNLVNSQQARRILDRIVGYKLSPFLWKSVKSGLSAGRVQSVATRIIVDREEEIRSFIPEEYWTLDAMLSGQGQKSRPIKAKFYGSSEGKIELHTKEETECVLEAVKDSPFCVTAVKKAIRYKNPPPPFTTSTMQQEASRKLSFQSQRIMKVAQELYEGIDLGPEFGGVHGLITYMRTDSLRISTEAQEAAKTYILDKFGDKYLPEQPRVYKSRASAQDAHEAIRPSNMDCEPEKIKKQLTPDQFKLYRLIWNRFLASQMQSAELDTVTADITSGGYLFRSSGYIIKFRGYMAVYEESEDEERPASDAPEKSAHLPELSEGDILPLNEVLPEQHFTEPPARYNEASLIKFFEEKGIGRPSTYTPIITTIIARGYVAREGKALKPTPLGEITNKLMVEYFPDIVDVAFTAKMEDELDDIEQGDSSVEAVLSSFYADFAAHLEQADANVEKGAFDIPVEETDIVCEKCGANLVIKTGRYGKFAACPNYPRCRNTKPLNADGTVDLSKAEEKFEPTDLTCELCGGHVVMRPGKYGAFYACEHYPTCKYTKPLLRDIGVPCPKCGGKIVQKRGKNRMLFYSCEHYPSCDFSSWDIPQAETCPVCGEILYRKKGKNFIFCHNKDCNYKRECPPLETETATDTTETQNPPPANEEELS
ncbi:MAG: type I DNA topoisomerase [Clostridia bacterium]|nr:type I DNA topoisomerase [Clostridia bacterium]